MKRLAVFFVSLVVGFTGLAFAQTINTSTPVSVTIGTCSGTTINVSGVLHTVTHISADGQHGSINVNFADVSAPGYQVTGGANGSANVNLSNGSAEATINLHADVVGKGGSGVMHVVIFEHLTVNANGTVTVDNVKLSSTCN